MSFETDWTKFKFGLATDITNALAIAAPVDTGELRNSINHDIEGDEIHIEMARHGLYVELGTPPHIIKPVTAKALHWKDGGKDVFAKKVMQQLVDVGIRVELDDRMESMGKKVRDAQMEKVNYIVTIGDKEVEKKTLAVRNREGKTKFDVKVDKFVKDLLKEISEKKV